MISKLYLFIILATYVFRKFFYHKTEHCITQCGAVWCGYSILRRFYFEAVLVVLSVVMRFE